MTPALRLGKAGFVISFQNDFLCAVESNASKISVQWKSSKLDKQEEREER